MHSEIILVACIDKNSIFPNICHECMHLLSPFSLNLPLYEHKKRPSYILSVLSSIAIILVGKRELVVLL